MKFSPLLTLTALPILAALCLWSSSAQAYPTASGNEGAPKGDKFALMDANKDDKVSLEEFKGVFPGMREEAFAVIDKNSDTYIDRTEWDAFVKDHASGHMGSRMGEMKGGKMDGGMGNMMGRPGGMPAAPMDPAAKTSDLPLVTPPNGK